MIGPASLTASRESLQMYRRTARACRRTGGRREREGLHARGPDQGDRRLAGRNGASDLRCGAPQGEDDVRGIPAQRDSGHAIPSASVRAVPFTRKATQPPAIFNLSSRGQGAGRNRKKPYGTPTPVLKDERVTRDAGARGRRSSLRRFREGPENAAVGEVC